MIDRDKLEGLRVFAESGQSHNVMIPRAQLLELVTMVDDVEPIAWLRFWAAQRYTGRGDVECDEGFEVCKEGEKGVDGSPAFPVFDRPAAADAMLPLSWVSCDDQMPPAETNVLAVVMGEVRVAALFWERPGYEDTFDAFLYWDDPHDDGKGWEHHHVTHWMPLRELPNLKEKS